MSNSFEKEFHSRLNNTVIENKQLIHKKALEKNNLNFIAISLMALFGVILSVICIFFSSIFTKAIYIVPTIVFLIVIFFIFNTYLKSKQLKVFDKKPKINLQSDSEYKLLEANFPIRKLETKIYTDLRKEYSEANFNQYIIKNFKISKLNLLSMIDDADLDKNAISKDVFGFDSLNYIQNIKFIPSESNNQLTLEPSELFIEHNPSVKEPFIKYYIANTTINSHIKKGYLFGFTFVVNIDSYNTIYNPLVDTVNDLG